MAVPVKTMNPTLGDLLKSEYAPAEGFCREVVTLKSGTNYKLGSVLGQVTQGTASSSPFAGNTGNGVMGAITVGINAKAGDYKLVVLDPVTNAGAFELLDPDGKLVATGKVATAFNSGGLSFTLADGATDFIAGDGFTITVATGTLKCKLAPDAADASNTDGSDDVYGILLFDTDATSADQTAVILRRGPAVVSDSALVYDASVSDNTKKGVKKAQLVALGIVVAASA